jgi:hypothetical protein
MSDELSIPRQVPGIGFASPQCAQIVTALAAAQGKFRAPKRTKTATVRPRDGGAGYSFAYAPLDEVIDAVKDGLAETGIARVQFLIKADDGFYVRSVIWHAGEWLGNDYPVMTGREGAQAFAGGVTYAKRQGLCMLLGIAPEDDDDGNAAEGNAVQVTAPQGRPQPRRPKPPATNVMQPPYDPQTGEVMERPAKQLDEDYQRNYVRLTNASRGYGLKEGQKAKDKLREEWIATEPAMQHRLLGNLPGWKQVAEETDLGFDMAREPER